MPAGSVPAQSLRPGLFSSGRASASAVCRGVQSPTRGRWDEYLDKAGAVSLLRLMAQQAPAKSPNERGDAQTHRGGLIVSRPLRLFRRVPRQFVQPASCCSASDDTVRHKSATTCLPHVYSTRCACVRQEEHRRHRSWAERERPDKLRQPVRLGFERGRGRRFEDTPPRGDEAGWDDMGVGSEQVLANSHGRCVDRYEPLVQFFDARVQLRQRDGRVATRARAEMGSDIDRTGAAVGDASPFP